DRAQPVGDLADFDPAIVRPPAGVLRFGRQPHGEKARLGTEWKARDKTGSSGQRDLGRLDGERKTLILPLPYKRVIAWAAQRKAGDAKTVEQKGNIELAVDG